ncbi:hypothetical protein C5167_040744 [Papaver somniferum]|uniref:Uncharacterized protein n=1 Tax=Papaver somniferum TaxID=3469 RepID=A0A4Y7IG06_PAPSO|nr:hypothetical protein C5167_040744 [Papaver somniferum]
MISSLISEKFGVNCCVLMGVNIANEITMEKFSEATVGYREDKEVAERWVKLFGSPHFQVSACLSKALAEDELVYPRIQLSSRNLIKMARSLLITLKCYEDVFPKHGSAKTLLKSALHGAARKGKMRYEGLCRIDKKTVWVLVAFKFFKGEEEIFLGGEAEGYQVAWAKNFAIQGRKAKIFMKR